MNENFKTKGAVGKKWAVWGVLLLLAVALGGLSGCNEQATVAKLADAPVRQYVHEVNGAALTIPKDWQTTKSDDHSTTFSNPDNTISMAVRCEIGGFSYFSYPELEEAAIKIAQQSLTEPQIITKEVYKGIDSTVRVVATGQLEDKNAVCEILVVSPLDAVRYYIITTSGIDKYEANSKLLADIYNSFYVGVEEDQLYKQISKE